MKAAEDAQEAWKKKNVRGGCQELRGTARRRSSSGRRVRAEREDAKRVRDAAEKESARAKATIEEFTKKSREAEKSRRRGTGQGRIRKAAAKFEAEVKRRRDEMTARELALTKRSNDVEEAAMDVAAQVAKAAESRAASEAALEQCRAETERLEQKQSDLEKEAARVNAQRTVVERAFEDAQEERRVLAEAADEADAVRDSLEKSVAELGAKHADADARAAVLDEVTALHQQWEREQEERERVARDAVEVAEAAERAAEEQTARARSSSRRWNGRGERLSVRGGAGRTRERSWRTRGGRSAGTPTGSARRRTARPSARSVRVGGSSPPRLRCREFGTLDEPGSDPSTGPPGSVPHSPLAPPPTPGGDLAAATAARKAAPRVLRRRRARDRRSREEVTHASDRAVSEMIGKVEEIDTYSLEDDAAAAAAAHAMLPGDPSDVVTPSPRAGLERFIRFDDDDGAVVRVAGGCARGGWRQGRPLLAHATFARLMEKESLSSRRRRGCSDGAWRWTARARRQTPRRGVPGG